MGQILKAASVSPEFQSLLFLQEAASHLEEDGEFHTAWRHGISRQGKATGLAPADMELLQHFGDSLGRTDVEGQLENCRIYAEQLAQRLEQARMEASSKNRLYTTLGVTGGLALALLLL